MKNLTKRIEFLANIAIIVVAVLIVAVLIKGYFFKDHAKEGMKDARIAAGTKVSINDVDWAKNGQTLLVVLQKGCHFCSESAPFYQRLARENIRLVAVLPQKIDEGKQYLADLGVSINEVRQAQLDTIGVRGTPTLILVNNNGVVTDSWVGKLPADKESEVMERVRAGTAAR